MYRLLAVAVPVNSNTFFTQWYDGIEVHPDSVMQVPMPIVPPNARGVAAGVGITPSVDFHFSLATGAPPVLSAEWPVGYMLEQNYPNPFNPSTKIGFRVLGEKNGSGVSGLGSSFVKLVVYDLLGREVAVLVNEKKESGGYTVQVDATGLASGIYFYRLQSENFVQTRKMLLIR